VVCALLFLLLKAMQPNLGEIASLSIKRSLLFIAPGVTLRHCMHCAEVTAVIGLGFIIIRIQFPKAVPAREVMRSYFT